MSVISSLLVFLFYQLGVIKGVNAQLVIIATLLVPVRALLAQQCAFLNAFQKPALAKVPEQIILPFISALFLFFIYYYFPNLTLEVVLMSVVLASILSQIISLVISRKTVDIKHENVKSKWKTKVWSRSLVPFAIIAFIYTLNSEVATIFLGNLGSHEEVAYFKVAIQAVAIISIGLSSVNSVIMPKVAMTYESGDVILTQHIIRKGVRYSFALSIFIALAYVLFGKELIELLFGSGYEKVYDILVVLTIYQMIDVILGPVGLILNMTGNEGKTVYRLVFVLFVNVVLLYFLTPLYGAIGAAYAMLISLVILKILMCFAVYKTTGLRSYIH